MCVRVMCVLCGCVRVSRLEGKEDDTPARLPPRPRHTRPDGRKGKGKKKGPNKEKKRKQAKKKRTKRTGRWISFYDFLGFVVAWEDERMMARPPCACGPTPSALPGSNAVSLSPPSPLYITHARAAIPDCIPRWFPGGQKTGAEFTTSERHTRACLPAPGLLARLLSPSLSLSLSRFCFMHRFFVT